jgi:hypothetical protein
MGILFKSQTHGQAGHANPDVLVALLPPAALSELPLVGAATLEPNLKVDRLIKA